MATLDTFLLDLNALQLGAYRYDYVIDDAFFAALDQNEILGGKVQSQVDLTVRENTCSLQIHLQGDVKITCDRCLDELIQPIEANEVLLVKVGVPSDTLDEDAIFVDPKSGALDLAWLIYELIEINLPLVHSHQAGECNPDMQALLQTHLCTTVEEPEDN